MQFNILVGNHGHSFHSLQLLGPLVNYVRSALSLCGHEVTVARDSWSDDAVNLLFEHFPDPGFWTNEIRDVKQRRDCTIGVVATELMIDNAIPYGQHGIRSSDAGDNGQGQAAYLRRRIDGFNAVAPEVDFLWSFLERTALDSRSRCAISRFFPVGHATGTSQESRQSPKDIDVAFFGTMNPHRVATLKQMALEKNMRVVVVGHGTAAGVVPDYMIASLLDRAKIGLNLTLSAVGESPAGTDPRFASCIRMTQMLERDVCVVSEEIPLDNPYKDFMISSPLQGLTDVCLGLLKSGEWRERGTQSAARFRKDMHVSKVCAPVIDATLTELDARAPNTLLN